MNTKLLRVSLPGLALVGLGLLFSPVSANAAAGDIVDKAVSTPALSTLVSLVTQANLVGALQGEGPYTVFAPTNEAFENLPNEIMNLIANDPSVLPAILTYHVVSGAIPAAQVPKYGKVSTLEGGKVTVRNQMGEVRVNNAKVIIADVTATNGVVHVIDKVLIPPSLLKNIIEKHRHQISEHRKHMSREHRHHRN